jgi:hypothetical protein
MQIIVWHSKHGNYYYDASTVESWDKSAIKILEDLIDIGYMNPEMYKPYISNKDKELAEIDLDALPDAARAALEKDVVSARRSIKNQNLTYENEKKQFRLASDYIEKGESPTMTQGTGTRHERKIPASWIILQNRNGGEYERFELETVYTG